MWRVTAGVSRRFTLHKPSGSGLSGTLLNECRLCSTRSYESNKQQDVKGSRSYSAPPPPPQLPPSSKEGGNLFFKLLGFTLIGTGGIIGYAWYDEKFRSTVEQRLPYSEKTFKYIFQYLPSSRESTPERTESLAASPEEIKQFSLVKKKDTPSVEDAKPETKIGAVTGEQVVGGQKDEEAGKDEQTETKEKRDDKELDKAMENAALESILRAVLAETESAVVIAVEMQTAATKATHDHTKKLRQVMDSEGEDSDNEWLAAVAAFSAKSGTLAQAESATENARLQLEKFRTVITDGRSNADTRDNNILLNSEEKLTALTSDLNQAITQNAKAQGEACVMTKYRELLRKSRDQLKKELRSITTADKDSKMTEQQLNSLIAHAHRRIEQLQHSLEEHQKGEQNRIEAALEKQRQLDEEMAKERIKKEHKILDASFELVADQWELDQRVEFELELRQQLSRQAAAHSDHLTNVLKVNEKKLTENFEEILANSLDEQRLQFQRDITGWIAKLKGFESALDARAEVREKLRKSQELWLACERLHSIVKNGPDVSDILLSLHGDDNHDNDHAVDPEDNRARMKPLLDEFIAVLDASANHPLVTSILDSVPDEAIHRGVCTEQELKQRFQKVHRSCRRVALIDESGGSLYKYIVSYMQSLLILSVPLSHSDRVDLSELDVYTILDHAKYHLDQGDLESALRFMNLLTGEPRKIASDWIKEARLLLETRQITDILLAHASVDGLGALF
ncbi:hypothetical protein LSH36_98g06001 [Paralvinella palmiformis]|uniref:MICOS complex subunit MIC60 n=1 Tax=Paralvinella palmiformis TaxID=53620 RepID=A0AAD9K139_9ANNE|nr:hypothetical protein LSH36_98g06001 [Paralvinella palmiformis]